MAPKWVFLVLGKVNSKTFIILDFMALKVGLVGKHFCQGGGIFERLYLDNLSFLNAEI